MTQSPFPTVSTWTLPAELTALPARDVILPEDRSRQSADRPAPPDDETALAQAVSEAIARRTRQRRYTI